MKKKRYKAMPRSAVTVALYLALSTNIHIDFSRSSQLVGEGSAKSSIQFELNKTKPGERDK